MNHQGLSDARISDQGLGDPGQGVPGTPPPEAADPVSVLLHLQRRARDAEGLDELGFVIVNETHALTPYRQAALWESTHGVTAVSGVAVPDDNAPFTLWLERVCSRLGRVMEAAGPVDPASLSAADREEWSEWLPASGLWVPMRIGGMLLAREAPWTGIEIAVLSEIGHAYGHALWALRRPSAWVQWRQRVKARQRTMIVSALAILGLGAVPVPLTVLAPAEVVAANPAVIRAPLDGVIDSVRIHPNDAVTKGELLFTLDDTTLTGKVEVAEKALATAEAELRQVSQQAVFDPAAQTKLAVAAGERDERAAELAYLKQELARVRVKAPGSGIAVLDDPSEWIGRPVSVGEKVMELAEARDTEIEAWLAPGNAIALKPGDALTLFLNVSPLAPVHARITTVAYEATPRPDGKVAYRVRARIDAGAVKPRLGLKGTARMSGHLVPLAYWLFRRPIAAIRAWAGL